MNITLPSGETLDLTSPARGGYLDMATSTHSPVTGAPSSDYPMILVAANYYGYLALYIDPPAAPVQLVVDSD
jgi:hypothetical protein